jgi:putative PIN family toxin of toxin-antitoxin system
MRVVLDTNILVSALIAPAGNPAAIYNAWEQGKFTLLTCPEHLDELRSTLQKPKVADLIKPYKAGRLVNQIRKLAEENAHRTLATTSCWPWRKLATPIIL